MYLKSVKKKCHIYYGYRKHESLHVFTSPLIHSAPANVTDLQHSVYDLLSLHVLLQYML